MKQRALSVVLSFLCCVMKNYVSRDMATFSAGLCFGWNQQSLLVVLKVTCLDSFLMISVPEKEEE